MVIEGSKLGTVRPSHAELPPVRARVLLHLARGADPPVASPGQIKIVRVHGMHDGLEKKRTVSRSETRERNKRLTVRFLDTEYEVLTEKAEAAGLSPGAYMRACALGSAGPRARRSPTVNREQAAQAIAALNKAGSNLNQIAHALNIGFQPEREAVEKSAEAVKQAALQILQAFGYKTYVR